VCIGSIDELAELSGVKVEDLHRDRLLNNNYCSPDSANNRFLKAFNYTQLVSGNFSGQNVNSLGSCTSLCMYIHARGTEMLQ